MSIEAMKQALEALEYYDKPRDEYSARTAREQDTKAITSLRQAIAEAEKHEVSQEPVAWVDLLKAAEQIVKDKFLYKRFIDGTPLANDIPCWMADFAKQYTHPQPKQSDSVEPVGVVGMDVSRPHMRSLDGQYFGQKPDTKTVMLFKDLEVGTKLYTNPQPKREWVGLTDEDRQAAFESLPDMLDGFLKKWGWLHFSKAIEAKLKEKNT